MLFRNKLLLAFLFVGLAAFLTWLFTRKPEAFVSYAEVVLNPDQDKLIKRIIPNSSRKWGKPVNVYNQYQNITTPPSQLSHNILFDMEPHEMNSQYEYDFIITTKILKSRGVPNCVYIPAWSFILGESDKWSIPDLLKRSSYPKSKFCAYMYSNCNIGYNGVKLREEFFEKLNSRKRVDALGKCKHNVPQDSSRHTSNWIDTAIDSYKPYKFAITVENTLNLQGYISEKIILALLAGCVPIYAGDKSVLDQLNPACFIYIDNYNSIQDCIDYVLEVDMNNRLYETYTTASIISKENLVRYSSWYYGTKSLYDKLFTSFSHLKRIPYVPINRTVQTNPYYPIKVINLDKSVDRWKRVLKQFSDKPFLKYERFPAVYGKSYYSIYEKYINTRWLGRNFRKGELGIYLSTMEVLNTLLNDEKNEYYLLTEDDIVLNKNIQPIEHYIRELPDDWDMLFLGPEEKYCLVDTSVKYMKMDMNCMPCNYAVVFRKRAAQYFINFAFPIEAPIDEFYRMHSANLNMYVYTGRVITVNYNLMTLIQKSD